MTVEVHQSQWISGTISRLRIDEVAAQLRGVGRFAHQVQFVAQVFGEFGDHLARLQALAVRPQPFEQHRQRVEQGQVVLDDRQHVRAQDLDRDFVAAVFLLEHCEMDLGDRRRGDRHRVELGEDLARRAAISLFDFGQRQMRIEGRHAILQLGQFVGDVGWHQVAPRRQYLAEFDENRPQRFQRHAQPYCARRRQVAPELQEIGEAHQAPGRLMFKHHFVEAIAAGDGGDLEQTENAHGRRGSGGPGKSNEHVNTQAANSPAQRGIFALPAAGVLCVERAAFLLCLPRAY